MSGLLFTVAVVASAADIAMGGRLGLLRLFEEKRLLIKAVF
jgi:hypothetical protein